MRINDSHVHVDNSNPEKLIQMADHFGYEKLCAQGIPCCGNRINNLECLAVKALAPGRAYAYGGMVYAPDLVPTRESHEKQLRLLMDAGFDGWKILESKPSVYRRLRLPLDSDAFDGAFSMAEAEGVPVTWHAGDPATFWDEKTAPEFAVKYHWLCVGEGFPSLTTIYTQVENVLARHPGLRATLAHLYFTSDDRPHAERLLDRYKNLCFDITPGSEMYFAFMEDREGWRKFFEKYRFKLVYGTDMVDGEDDVVFGSQDAITEFVLSALMKNERFSVHGFGGTGLGLSEDVLRPLMAENFDRIAGPKPKEISKSGLNAYCEWLMPHLDADERARAEELLALF